MKVWIDQDLCTGDGLCEEIAPAVFTLLDDGLAYVKEGDRREERARWLGRHGRACPPSSRTRWSRPPRSARASASSSSRADRSPVSPRLPVTIPLDVGSSTPRVSTTRLDPGRRREAAAGRGQEPGVAHHPVVGSDRTGLDVPGPVEHLQAWRPCRTRCSLQRRPQLGGLVDGGQVGAEDPPRPEGLLGVGQDPPRLGQVEQDPVEPHLVDALVDVADLHPVAGVAPAPMAATLLRARSAKSSRSS